MFNLKVIPQITAAILLASAISLTAQTVSMETPTSQSVGRTSFVAYYGIPNYIIAVVENMSCDSFFLTTDNGTIVRDAIKKCEYTYKPELIDTFSGVKTFADTRIWYNRILDNDTIRFAEKQLKVRPIPFVAEIAGKNGRIGIEKVEKKRLLSSFLRMDALNTGYSASLNVDRFKVTAFRCSTMVYEKEFKNGWQTNYKTFASELSMLESGDLVIFEDIYYTYFGGLELRADGIYLKIE